MRGPLEARNALAHLVSVLLHRAYFRSHAHALLMSPLSDAVAAALGAAYRIDRELGGGGMSHVFVAEEVAFGRRVVVKVLPPDMVAGVNADRFRREIQMAAQLQHPGIVPLLTAGSKDELLWYIMPFVEGASLRAKIARGGGMPLDEAVRAWRDLLEALEYAHQHNVIHRDIKPENIMLAGRHAVVLDFGVAKAVSAATGMANSTQTAAGIAIGTPAYMAPEQVAGEGLSDPRTDLYAAGLVMYEMLAGRGPFEGARASELMAAHIGKPPPPLSTLRPGLPMTLEALVMQCLAKTPEERPASASVILQALDAMSGELSGARTPSGTPWGNAAAPGGASANASAVGGAAPAPRGRRVWLIGAMALVVAAVAASGSFFAKRSSNEAEARLGRNLLDTMRLQVAFLPVEREAADSALGRTLSNALLTALQSDKRLSPLGDERMQSIVSDAGLVLKGKVADTLRAVARDFGVHVALQPAVARVGSGFLVSAEARTLLSDSLLFRTEATAKDVEAVPAAFRAVVERSTEGLAAAFSKVKRPLATGRLFGTTPEAARIVVSAFSAFDRADFLGAAELAREAVREDTTFAVAWGFLATVDANMNVHPQEAFTGTAKAYAYRDRIPTRSGRAVAAAEYLRMIGDQEGSAREVQAGLASLGSSGGAMFASLNNLLALTQSARRRYEASLRYYQRASDSTYRLPGVPDRNQMVMLLQLDRVADAAALLQKLDSAAGRENATVLRMREEFQWARMLPESVLTASAARLKISKSATTRVATGTAIRSALASMGRMDSAAAVERARRAELATMRDTASLLLSALNEATVRAEQLGELSRASVTIDSVFKTPSWAALAPLDRPYQALVTALAAAGRPADARRAADEWMRVIPREMVRRTGWAAANARGEVALAEKKGAEALAAFRAGDSISCDKCAYPLYARAFDAMGQRDSAIVWYERYVTSTEVRLANSAHVRFLARAYLRLGELHEAAGNPKQAIQRYGDFVNLWKNADPALQGAVKSARDRIAKLQASTG